MSKLFVLSVILFISNISNAQDFGDIPDEWLQLKEFEKEPDADAVIIFDKADVEITRGFNQVFNRHIRIKVLTEEGKKYGDVKIRVSKSNEFYGLEASSFNPEGDEFELEDDNLFKEEQGASYLYSFAIPGVEIGSVIEYEYNIVSENITKLPSWTFQSEDYTLLSQISLTIPRGFVYNKVEMNLGRFDFTETHEDIRDATNPDKKIGKYTWKVVDIPGLKKEPFVDNLKDELARIIFMLRTYKDPYYSYNFAKTWDDIAEMMYKFYDDYVEEDVELNEELKDIFALHDKVVKTRKIYDYVRTEIKTLEDRNPTMKDYKKPSQTLAGKEASGEEKNILLIALLKQAGIDADMIFISSLDHGKLIPSFTDYSQFNNLICRAVIDKKQFYLDTANPCNPFCSLTPNCNVVQGLLVVKNKGKIVRIKNKAQHSKLEITSTGKIKEDTLKVESKFTFKGYEAFNERNAVIDKDTVKHIKDKLKDLFELAQLDTFYYKDLDSLDKPLELVIQYSLPEYIETTGDMVYFKPPMFTNRESNPFKRNYRSFPIFYDYPVYSYEKCSIELPSDMKVLDLPPRIKKSLKEYSYRKIYSQKEGMIESVRIRNIKKRVIRAEKYTKLKALYDDIVASDQEQIVLSANRSN